MSRQETATPDWTAEDRLIGTFTHPADLGRHPCPEETFWRWVIRAALLDAQDPQYVSSATERDRERRRARHWLLNDNGAFIRVCLFAGVDPQAVRKYARVTLQ